MDYFVDGQICHETNQKRHTEVHIQCCDGLTLPSPPQSSETFLSNYYTKKNGGGQIGVELVFASLNAITEPGLCAYEATVCTPLLCSPKDAAEVSTTTGTSSKKNDIKNSKTPYKDVMKIINGTCLMKQEDWWTYEVCFSRGVRQMHFNIDQSFAKDGSIIQTKVLASQFHLGLANVSVYEHEDLLANLSR